MILTCWSHQSHLAWMWDTTRSSLYLDILLEIDRQGRVRTKLCDKDMISIFQLWTFHLYVITFQRHLHMEYISLSWDDIPELVVQLCKTSDATQGYIISGTTTNYLLWVPVPIPGVLCGSCCSILVLCVVLCRSLFVDFLWAIMLSVLWLREFW